MTTAPEHVPDIKTSEIWTTDLAHVPKRTPWASMVANYLIWMTWSLSGASKLPIEVSEVIDGFCQDENEDVASRAKLTTRMILRITMI